MAGNEERGTIIVPVRLLRSIDESRGQMGRAEFIEFCIERALREAESPASSGQPEEAVSREEFEEFKRRLRDLQRSQMDVLLSISLDPTAGASDEEKQRFKRQVSQILDVSDA